VEEMEQIKKVAAEFYQKLLSTGFYKAAWPIISYEVVQAIQSFFEMDNLLKEANATIIAFVPKKRNLPAMSEIKPISSCNVI
jgi:23S rRNA G2069 N7-methylase RlmK/C1962 C5-methylase RlmI